jgi:hypothetical protein
MTDPTPPTPLRRAPDRDAAEARAAHLLGSVDGWADAEDALAERRVWRKLQERVVDAGSRRRLPLWRPAVLATGLLLASGAVAGATVGREFLRVRIERLLDGAPTPPRHEAASSVRRTAHAPAAAPAAAQPEPALAPPPPRPEPSEPRRVLARPAARPQPRPVVVAPEPAAPAAPSAEEGKLVMDAALALRREGSPARARELLERYVARYPSGVLLDEVLALAMEAAQTPEAARAAARLYLDRFPNGRFARVARDTVSAGER